MNIRLEYSPVNGQFNCANALDRIDIENGYRIISCVMNNERAHRFIGYLHLRFPQLKLPVTNSYLTTQQVKIELLEFIKQDLLLLEKEMDRTFVRATSK